MTHKCIGKRTIIGSDNGLSPGRGQAIIWINAGILLIGPWGTNFSEIVIIIQTFSLKKTCLKMSSAKCCPFHLGLNKLTGPPSCLLHPYNHTTTWQTGQNPPHTVAGSIGPILAQCCHVLAYIQGSIRWGTMANFCISTVCIIPWQVHIWCKTNLVLQNQSIVWYHDNTLFQLSS